MLGNNTVPQVNSARDLGVIVDSCLKFDIHINHIVSRVHRLANLVHKSFISRVPSTLMRAFVKCQNIARICALCLITAFC